MTKPTISVTMPAYNAAQFIGEAIESVLSQDYADFELLIIDDGSTDETIKIIKRYHKHPKVRWYTQDHHGIGATRNRLVEFAHGRYISSCDADDKILPNKIKRHVQILDAYPNVAVVYGDILVMSKHGRIVKDQYLMAKDLNNWWDLLENVVMHCGATIRKSAILKVGGYDPLASPAEDYDLWLKLAEIYKFKYINELCAVYRSYSESTSRRDKQLLAKGVRIKKNAILRRYGQYLAPKLRW